MRRLQRFVLIVWALACPSLALAQGGVPSSPIAFTGPTGRPLAGATITVCQSTGVGFPCSPLASIFTNAALSIASPNPVTTDGNGNIPVIFASPGVYILSVTGSGITSTLVTATVAGTGGGNVTTSGPNAFTGNNTFGTLNNICWIDGTVHSGLTGINACNGLFTTATPGLTWIPSNTASLANWATPSNGAMLVDTRFVNDQGLGEGGLPFTHSHMLLDFHVGANDAYESNNFSGPNGLSINAFADGGGTIGQPSRAFVIGIYSSVQQAAGSIRPIEAANFVMSYKNYSNPVIATEIDFGNNGVSDDTGTTGTGLLINSTGLKKTGLGLSIRNSSGVGGVDQMLTAAQFQSFSNIGLEINGGGPGSIAHYIIPPANDANIEIVGRNAANNANIWDIDNSGNFFVKSLQNSAGSQASTGFVRLANTDKIAWRNAAGTGDDALGEVQHARVASCSTGAAANSVCSTTVTWPSAFADANYTPVCLLVNANQAQAAVTHTGGAIAAASISVEISNFSVATAASGTISCTGTHD